MSAPTWPWYARSCFSPVATSCLATSLRHKRGFGSRRPASSATALHFTTRPSSSGFPLIIKSPDSAHRVHGRKAYVAQSRSEFDAAFGQWPADVDQLLVQRYLEGPLASCDYVAADGKLVGYCEACVTRTDMPDGSGFAVEFESIPPSADLLKATSAFVGTHNYSGPGLIQFIRDRTSGELFFLENNPRLAAGIAHTIDSGQDLARLTVEVASGCVRSGQARFVAGGYRYGYRAHWLMRDVQGFLAQRKKIGLAAQRRWLFDVVRASLQAHGHITWQWRDPLPTMVIYSRFLRSHVAHLLSRGGVR